MAEQVVKKRGRPRKTVDPLEILETPAPPAAKKPRRKASSKIVEEPVPVAPEKVEKTSTKAVKANKKSAGPTSTVRQTESSEECGVQEKQKARPSKQDNQAPEPSPSPRVAASAAPTKESTSTHDPPPISSTNQVTPLNSKILAAVAATKTSRAPLTATIPSEISEPEPRTLEEAISLPSAPTPSDIAPSDPPPSALMPPQRTALFPTPSLAAAASGKSKASTKPVQMQPPKTLPFKSTPSTPSSAIPQPPPADAANPVSRPTPTPRPGLTEVEAYQQRYNSKARKITLAMVAAPIAIVTSYVLYERLVIGQERRTFPTYGRSESEKGEMGVGEPRGGSI